MTELLIDKRELIKQDDGYIWHTEFSSKLTEEDFKKNKDFLESRVRLLEKELAHLNIKQLLGAEEKKLKQQKTIKEHALRNFDQYWEEEINKLRAKGEEEKKTLEVFINQYKTVKDIVLQKVKTTTKEKRKALQIQLEDAKENLRVYQNV